MLSILKQILTDDKSLAAYFSGSIVTFEDIRRRIFLLERNSNRNIPDHHYRLQLDDELEGIATIPDLFTTGLYRLAADFLELRGNKVHVKAVRQNDWQELITYIPPLLLIAAYLQKNIPLTDYSPEGIVTYYNQNVLYPNAKYTALPYPYILQLEQYRKDNNGFNDLHMHLNGSIETDNAWQDFLAYPEKIYNDLEYGFKNPKVKEQFEQESHFLDPKKFYSLLLIAQKLRNLLFEFVFPETNEQLHDNQAQLLFAILGEDEKHSGSRHPFRMLVNGNDEYDYDMAVECLMYILVIQKLEQDPQEVTGWMFHFYLLILGLSNRLLVQQMHQYGFEQFQKHTLNDLRRTSEKEYRKRFFQLNGNGAGNLRFLEGRFAPQRTEAETIGLIDNIYKGWNALLEHTNKNQGRSPELKLVAHLIKRVDHTPNDEIRFYDLRKDNWERAGVLSIIIKNYPEYAAKILGADAAASEFDTPPEVFAPALRRLRRAGIKHFTYHAGEDFFHIISGLRAVYEAVEFTEMMSGDRIGHATASSISTENWYLIMGQEMRIKQGEWLDNLVFIYHLIIRNKITSLKKMLPYIIYEIEKYSFEIYEEAFPVKVLEDAWLLRKYCPIQILSGGLDNARLTTVFDEIEWKEIVGAVANLSDDNILIRAFAKYHGIGPRRVYEKIITIQLSDFPAADTELLQQALLEYMHRKEIVIETLPTSNVRIGHYNNYSQYHLWNWFKWEEEGHAIPPIVVGSDDTGIFATNIYNEYANIYCCLTGKGLSHNKTMTYIEKLDKNGRIYKFA